MRHVSQRRGELRRRWFSDDHFDLYIWEDDGEIAGFQLCYAKEGYQRALTWMEGGTPYHTGVDEGSDRNPTRMHAPILVADGTMDVSVVRERFAAEGEEIEPSVRDYVVRKLEELELDWPDIGV